MSEADENASQQAAGLSTSLVSQASAPPASPPNSVVSFNRRELDTILRLYGRMVADGEWRDYAIDLLKEKAVFSVFRRSSEMPLYRIEKDPKLARRQGAYSVVATGGMVLKRGHDLSQVLRVLEKKKHLRVVGA
ncbi:DUF2794 domain-containing protein [Roseibium denhamense]|uniref:DUF2794 domain-containing protein n=1 Tax=Roseibium denhamense TaxID=76305 RepID=A0ABY1P9N7_9HYPH|nr:DUF2794 domain-containing protein [Roseibium denhamense]MTI07406.1 DUF2794 domain-containing protein [Roseibium denhamense]SMP29395.1 Protein of unknown function [Roseibium denhamense]